MTDLKTLKRFAIDANTQRRAMYMGLDDSWITAEELLQDGIQKEITACFIAAASPDVILALITEHEEQARLLGMSGSREADLLAKIERLKAACNKFSEAEVLCASDLERQIDADEALIRECLHEMDERVLGGDHLAFVACAEKLRERLEAL